MLTSSQIRFLRSRAHHLKPIVQIGGKGVTPAVLAELDRALHDHELIKVSIAGAGREDRLAVSALLCEQSGAETVQLIGRVAVLYRPAPEPRLVLPV